MTDLNKTGTFAATTDGNFNVIPYNRAKSFRITNFTGKIVGVRRRHQAILVDDFNDTDFSEWTGNVEYETSELEGTGAARVNNTSYRMLTNEKILDGSEVEFTFVTPSTPTYSIKFSVYDDPTRIGMTGGFSVTITESNSKSYTKYIVSILINPSSGTYEAYIKEDGVDRVNILSGTGGILANNHQFDKLYAFGNSYTDSGNYPDELWEDREDVWVQYLAQSLSVPFTQSAQGGTNFAFGGARLSEDVVQGSITVPSIQSQISSAPNFTSNDLVAFFGGGNDYLGAGQDSTYILAGIKDSLELLVGKGARNIVMLNMVNLLTLPGVTDPGAQTVSQEVNASLAGIVNTLKSSFPTLNIYTVDLYTIADSIVADPASYGITENPFYDTVHMIKEAHKIFADEAYKLLPSAPIIAIEPSTKIILDPVIYNQKVNYSNEQIGHGGSFVYPCGSSTSEYEIINLGSDALNYSDSDQTISISGFYAR